MRIVFFLTILFSLAGQAFTQNHDLSALKADEAGRRVIAYFDAYNAGEDQLRAFFTDNIAADSLKQRPVEPRLAFHKQVRANHGKIELVSVVSIAPDEIKVIGRAAAGEMIGYDFNISPDKKIAGMGIGPVEEVSAPPIVQAPKTAAELPSSVEKLFDTLSADGEFSGVVLVAKDGTPIVSKAYGLADAAKNVPNRVDTKFNLGSINKMFTRISIGQLVKAGKLSFSDKLSRVLPDYPNKAIADRVTIGQIVTMTSGLGNFFNEKFLAGDPNKIRSLQDYLPLFVDVPLEFEPGTKSRYSNAGYLVLGLVIEKLSGQNYYEYVREHVFKPAGMTDTDSFEIDKLPPNTAVGYMTRAAGAGGAPRPNTKAQPGRGSSAGGGYSTAGDMLKFAAALKSGKLVIPNDDGTFPTEFTTAGFAGGSEGVNSIFLTSARSGYTVIVLSNRDPPSAEQPGIQVRDWIKQILQ